MRSAACLLLLAGFVASALAGQQSLPDCHVEKGAEIYFSDPQVPDRLLVSVVGAPCHSGTARIRIYSGTGALLYQHEQPFKPLTANQWDDPEIDRDAERFAKDVLNFGANTRRMGLPPWLPQEVFYEENHTTLAVPREVYEALQRSVAMVFYHPTYYEGGVHVVFDKELGAARVVLRGGL